MENSTDYMVPLIAISKTGEIKLCLGIHTQLTKL